MLNFITIPFFLIFNILEIIRNRQESIIKRDVSFSSIFTLAITNQIKIGIEIKGRNRIHYTVIYFSIYVSAGIKVMST